ncbi:hypothetical protein ACFOPQ_14015 [Deinococcus antarcticus]|uniref:DUF2946 family protein n=1 Tax=Deinococcus antarcticus TaxID=1298767 RepID=A0ABV8A851_9DEIO
MNTPATTRKVLRQVMALLTVVAAFMFPARVDGLGQLHPDSPGHGGIHGEPGIHQKVMPETGDHAQHHHLKTPPPVKQAHHHPAHPPTVPRQPEPASHQHSAHCPFCITNAFALEGGIEGLPTGPPDFLPSPEPFVRPVFLAAPHAVQARAPPPPVEVAGQV